VAGKRGLVYGVGVNDWGSLVRVDGKIIPEYQLWASMLTRCFCKKYKQRHPTYEHSTCCNEWLQMTKFIKDVSTMKGYGLNGWQFDKDILQKGNKLYSKDTCCFVPQELNLLLNKRDNRRGEWPVGVCFSQHAGKFIANLAVNGKLKHLGCFNTPEEAFQAYKVAKEDYIKEIAEKWKDRLDERVYQALLNYTVEITD